MRGFAGICLTLFLGYLGCAPALAKGPNVLLIIVDDLRPVTQGFAGPVSAPNLEALADEGYRFLNSYANVPVCGASRASMLSGLAPSSRRFLSYNSRLDVDAPGAVSLPGFFKHHGWYVVGNGKIFDVIEDSADSWSEPVWNPPMRWHSSTPQDERGEHLQKAYIRPLPTGRPPGWERLEVDDLAYPDGEIAARSVEDLRRLAARESPFFLAVGFRKPHLPFNVPARYWADEVADTDLLPASWYATNEYLPSSARHRSAELRMQYNALPLFGTETEQAAREITRAYHAASRYIDALIGQLVAALHDTGVADETIIAVTGDHGFFLGEHGMWTKHALLETALRTPLIIVDPSRTGGHSINAVVDLLDLFPTLAELAKLPLPAKLDGRSLSPLLDAPTLLSHPDKPLSVSRWINGESVRDARYRYTMWRDESGQRFEHMLFDLVNDPLETRNIANLPESEPIVARLSGELAKRRMHSGWSAEMATLVKRMKLANSATGALLLAAIAAPGLALFASLAVLLLVSGLIWLWRNRRTVRMQ